MIVMATLVAILVVMLLAIIRACRGETIQDRILAINLFGTKTVLLIAVTAHVTGSPDYLDIALVYALINFVSVIGALQFLEQQSQVAK